MDELWHNETFVDIKKKSKWEEWETVHFRKFRQIVSLKKQKSKIELWEQNLPFLCSALMKFSVIIILLKIRSVQNKYAKNKNKNNEGKHGYNFTSYQDAQNIW